MLSNKLEHNLSRILLRTKECQLTPLNNSIFRTYSISSDAFGDNPVYRYMKERETSSESSKNRTIKLIDNMEYLCGKKIMSMDIMFDNNINSDMIPSFLLMAQRYPKESYTTDGIINISLINHSPYTDYIRHVKICRLEEMGLNRRMVPIKKLYSNAGDFSDSRNLVKFQKLVDDNFLDVIDSIKKPLDLFSFVKYIYLLNINISISHSYILSKRLIEIIPHMNIHESIKLIVMLISFSNGDIFKYLLCALNAHLERNIYFIKLLSSDEVIDIFSPLSLIQFDNYNVWTIFNNTFFIDHITHDIDSLVENTRGLLLIILSLINQNNYRKLIVNSLLGNVDKISTYVILNAVEKLSSSSYSEFNGLLYKELVKRIHSIPANYIASFYIKYNNFMPKDTSVTLLNSLGRLLKNMSGNVIFDMYCCYLKNNECNNRQTRIYEYYIKHHYRSLTSKNISNILMYLSINGKCKSRIYDVIIRKFTQLKQNNAIKHNELLDIILSMSLVGIHKNDVWNGVDVSNLIYRIPKNILVYLGYSFLITNVKNYTLWQTLVNRILFETRHNASELYQVLKSAQILEFIPINDGKSGINLNKFDKLVQNCKQIYLNKLSKQRYVTEIPYEDIFNKVGLRFKKGSFLTCYEHRSCICKYYKFYEYNPDILIKELYEAPYVLTEYNIIIEPTQTSIEHITSGMIIGEAQLRYRVLKKLNYRLYSFHDSMWNDYLITGDNNKTWDIDKMVEFFCKSVKLWHLNPKKGRGRLPMLKLSNNKVLHTHHMNKIKKLQTLLIQQQS